MSERVIGGLRLREYAAIYAATSEGFPLEVVLEGEGVSPAEWVAADEAWGDELASDLQGGGSISDEFDLALLEAQAGYRRPIPPLDEDLGAWLRFVRAWAAAEDPVRYLQERGLGPNDLARLHRLWSQRIADDQALQRQALGLLEVDGPAPEPHPEPLELRPVLRRDRVPAHDEVHGSEAVAPQLRAPLPESNGISLAMPLRNAPAEAPSEEDDGKTWIDGPLPIADAAPDADRTQVPPSAAVDAFASVPLPVDFVTPPIDTVVPVDPSLVADDLTLAQYAALCAELEVSPAEDALAIFIKYGLANEQRRARVDELWRERLETRTQTYAEFRQLRRHFREHFLSQRRR
ncbi:MAG: hypothetical protein ACRELB_24320 [Polyangiaceae bacterium]